VNMPGTSSEPPEDPEKRRLRQLAETAGSLAPSRIGAWTTPGYIQGESWSRMPRLGRVAVVIVVVMLVAGVGLLMAATIRAGDAGAAVFIVALMVVIAVAVGVGRLLRRQDRRHAHHTQRPV
jgi:hypothetical protein